MLTCDALRLESHGKDVLFVVESGVQPLHLPQLQHCAVGAGQPASQGARK